MEMNVRMGYISIPIDYVRELKSKGARDKARAFIDYYDDVEMEEINSFSFYAKAWKISKTQTQAWVKEFKYEIERYFSYWLIKNSQHYSSVKKTTDRLPTDYRPIDTLKTPMVSALEKIDRPIADRLPTEVFNINNNNSAYTPTHAPTHTREVNFYSPLFEDFYIRAKIYYKFAGNKEDAYNEYTNSHQHISLTDMLFAYAMHVNDPQCRGKIFNLSNFMKNQIYISYLMPRLKLIKDEQILEGWYDKSKQAFMTESGMFELTERRFIELLSKGDIIILQQMKAAV